MLVRSIYDSLYFLLPMTGKKKKQFMVPDYLSHHKDQLEFSFMYKQSTKKTIKETSSSWHECQHIVRDYGGLVNSKLPKRMIK